MKINKTIIIIAITLIILNTTLAEDYAITPTQITNDNFIYWDIHVDSSITDKNDNTLSGVSITCGYNNAKITDSGDTNIETYTTDDGAHFECTYSKNGYSNKNSYYIIWDYTDNRYEINNNPYLYIKGSLSSIITHEVSINGTTTTGATVTATCEGNEFSTTSTDGTFSITGSYISTTEKPTCSVTASKEHYKDETINDQLITATGLDLTLTKKTHTITITVKDQEGTTITDATISISGASGTCTGNTCTVNEAEAFTITASKTGYNDATYTSTGITSDTTITITLKKTTHTVTIKTNPTGASLTAKYTDNDEAITINSDNTATIEEGRPFSITASKTGYNDATYTSTGITSDTTITLTLTNTITITVKDQEGTTITDATISISGASGTCTGNTCTVNYGESFTITANHNGYIIKEYTSTGITSDTTITLTLTPTLKITLNTIPLRGDLTIDGTTITSDGTGTYEIAATDGDHTINYNDNTGRYTTTPITINIDHNTMTSQEEVTLNINEVIYDETIDILDLNDNDAPINNLEGMTVKAAYDGIEHDCTYDGNTYHCSIPHATDYDIIATSPGYVTNNLNPQSQLTTLTPLPPIELERTLKIELSSETKPVNAGIIIINNSDNTQTITTKTIENTNTETEFYFNITPQVINAYYEDGEEYTNKEQEGVTINNNAQTIITLNSDKTYHTDIIINTPIGIINEATITTDDGTCYTNYCILKNTATTITASKTGYITNTTSIPDNNNGSPITITLNQTLKANITDQNNEPVSNGVITILKGDNEIATASINNGIAWVPVNPEENNEDLTMKIESDNYITNTTTINAGVIDGLTTKTINFKTKTMTSLLLIINDYYTQEEITDYTIRVWDNDNEYCTSNPCNFDMITPPSTVNITINKQGYEEENITNQETGVGTIATTMKPQVAVFFNTKFNATIINTKGTASTADDEIIIIKESTDNGNMSLPLDKDVEFIMTINATGYQEKTLGPYNSSINRLIGSEDNPEELIPLNSIELAPIITSTKYEPTNPTTSDNITITINASDEGRGNNIITACYLMKDNSHLWSLMNSTYDDYNITATMELANMTSGEHTITMFCHDDTNGDGENKEFIINIEDNTITPIQPAEEEEEETEEETPTETPITIKLSELKSKYEFIVKAGLNNPEITKAITTAEENTTTENLINAEKTLPLITLEGGGVVKTIKTNKTEDIINKIITREDQPYSVNELEQTIKEPIFQKTAKHYTLNGENKTVITLKIISNKDNPNAIIADYNPGKSNAENTIETSEGSITYFKGLNKGENVFEYVIDNDVKTTTKPIQFEMKELSGAEKTIKGITGFTIGIPGIIEVPAVYLGAGISLLLIIIKFLI